MRIKRNVMDSFGTNAGDEVIEMARHIPSFDGKDIFQVLQGNTVLTLENRKPAAATYLRGIKPKVWRSSSKLEDQYMPSRYGIVTSNTVESANSMFEDATEGSWLNSIEKSIHIMAKQISQ